MRTQLRGAALIAAMLIGLATPAAAQIQAPNRYDVVARVDGACPGLVRDDHAFTDAVASVLFAEDARWGRNGKRGNPNDPSHDALAYQVPGGPGGVAIVDIIVAAGGPNAAPGWQDVTAATIAAGTIGVWVRPSGVLPACLTGGSGPTPPPQPPPGPTAPAVDLRPVLDALARVEARQGALEERIAALNFSQPIDYAALDAFVGSMVGDGPDGDGPLPNHVTDLLQRIDVIRVTLEQLNAFLRSRAVLRY